MGAIAARLGVMGGTFDPVHNGHLNVAEEVRKRMKLDKVLFVPAGRPWMRAREPMASHGERLEMVRLATDGKDYFKVSDTEIARPGPSYMGETIAELRSKSDAGTEIYLIMGWDSVATLPEWKEPEKLVFMCRIVAVKRPGYARPDEKALETAIPGISGKLVVLDKPEMNVSASEIRERVASGLPFEHMVPEAVAKYINEHGLYKTKKIDIEED